MISRFIRAHTFFISESQSYIGKWDLFHVLYYPIAYFKFMSLMMNHEWHSTETI